jgi:hypothetical protein
MTSRRVKTKAGVDGVEKQKKRAKARVRAKDEWPFRALKRVFGFTKVRYRGFVLTAYTYTIRSAASLVWFPWRISSKRRSRRPGRNSRDRAESGLKT